MVPALPGTHRVWPTAPQTRPTLPPAAGNADVQGDSLRLPTLAPQGHSACRAPQVPLCLLLRPSGLSPASQWCHREPRTRGVWPLLMDKRTLWAAVPQSQTRPASATSQGDAQTTPSLTSSKRSAYKAPPPLLASKHPVYAGWRSADPGPSSPLGGQPGEGSTTTAPSYR